MLDMSAEIPPRDQCIPLLRRAIEKMSDSGNFEFFVESVRERIFFNTASNNEMPEIQDWYRTVYWILSHDPQTPERIPIGRQETIPVPTDSQVQDAYKVLNFLRGSYEKEKLPHYFQDPRILLYEFSYLREVDETELESLLENYKNLPNVQEFCKAYLSFHGFSAKFREHTCTLSDYERNILRELFAQPIKTLLDNPEVRDNIIGFVSFESLTQLQDTIQFDKELGLIAPSFFQSFEYWRESTQEESVLEEFLESSSLGEQEIVEFNNEFLKVKSFLLDSKVNVLNPLQLKTFFNFIDYLLSLDEGIKQYFLSHYRDNLIKIYLAFCESLSNKNLEDYRYNLIKLSQILESVKLSQASEEIYFSGYEFSPKNFDIHARVIDFSPTNHMFLFQQLVHINENSFLIGDQVLDTTRIMEIIFLLEEYIGAYTPQTSTDEEFLAFNQFMLICNCLMELIHRVHAMYRTNLMELLGDSGPRFEAMVRKLILLSNQNN